MSDLDHSSQIPRDTDLHENMGGDNSEPYKKEKSKHLSIPPGQ